MGPVEPKPEPWNYAIYHTMRDLPACLSKLEEAFDQISYPITRPNRMERIETVRKELAKACELTAQHAVALLMTPTSWAIQGDPFHTQPVPPEYDYLALDRDWRVIYVGGMCEHFFGKPADEIDGKVDLGRISGA